MEGFRYFCYSIQTNHIPHLTKCVFKLLYTKLILSSTNSLITINMCVHMSTHVYVCVHLYVSLGGRSERRRRSVSRHAGLLNNSHLCLFSEPWTAHRHSFGSQTFKDVIYVLPKEELQMLLW